jgi:hypothetical protein
MRDDHRVNRPSRHADNKIARKCVAAHDPPKLNDFGEKIMRQINGLERDRTQNRMPLLLIAL